ncbi:MAG: protein kinase [Phycisphaerae bacterium]|jgi:serine/threonine protein kinase
MAREQTIRINGHNVGVLDVFVIGGKRLFAVERLSGIRPRYKIFDPRAGAAGDYRVLQILPHSEHVMQYVHVLARVSQHNGNCPTILDFEARDGRIFVLLQWVAGPTLGHYLRRSRDHRNPGLSIYEAIRLFHGFAHGLTQLSHRKNIVHGDLHPENLVICREPNRLVMLDFGSAWLVERLARRRPSDGVHHVYAAPELLTSERRLVDFRADQFSASVIYYEMLTGRVPYEGVGGQAGLDGFESYRELVPPSVACPDRKLLPAQVWEKIDAAAMRGLALAPKQRFRNRREWLGALGDVKYALEKSDRLDEEDVFLIRIIRWLNRLFPQRRS